MTLRSTFTAVLASAALAVTTVSVGAAPAHAVGESSATTTTAYAGDNCIDHPVNYSVNLPADAKDWWLEIKPLYPNGAEGISHYVGTLKGSPMTGTVLMQICGGVEPLGTWTLQPILKSWRDAAGTGYYDEIPGTPSTFQVVGVAKTGLSLKAKKKGRTVKATAKLVAKTGSSTYPVTEQKVAFQKKVGKKWKTIKTATTSSTGKARAKFKVKGKTSIRARFAGAGAVIVGGSGQAIPAATSKTVRVR